MVEKRDLVDILREQRVITEQEASQVKLEQINTNQDVKTILLKRNLVDETQLTKALSEFLGIPFVDISQKKIPSEVLLQVPESVARQYVLIPFDMEGGELSVAMKDPLDLQVVEFLEMKTGVKIRPFIASPTVIERIIAEAYTAGIEKEVQAALRETEKEAKKIEEKITDIEKIGEIIKSAPVARIVSTILEYAVKARASDVHIEPEEESTRVRYRIDGVLQERMHLPRKVHEAVVSRIKILSSLKIDEHRIPQDGRFMISVGGMEVDLRVSTLPTSHGEKVVMRLLKKTGEVASFAELGLRGRALKLVEESLKKTQGIILVTGPTGSGKTTTLRTALERLNNVGVNIITLEDPVEYEVKGVNQVQINPQAGLTFASGLRSILRQDPDIIMVGEIRDMETAALAIQASLTGHLVLSTLHTNSAAGALPRLLDMKAEPFLLASTMETVVAQRLVRRLCPDCREKYEASPEIEKLLREGLGSLFPPTQKGRVLIYRAKGCEKCNHFGYIGRVGIFEVLPISEKIGRLILERETADRIQAEGITEGMVAMLQDGYLKVFEGITTIEEVLRVMKE